MESLLVSTLYIVPEPSLLVHFLLPIPPKLCTCARLRLQSEAASTQNRNLSTGQTECVLRTGKLGGTTSAQGQEKTPPNSSKNLKVIKVIKVFLSLEACRPSIFLEHVIKRLFAFMLPIISSSLRFSDQVNTPCYDLDSLHFWSVINAGYSAVLRKWIASETFRLYQTHISSHSFSAGNSACTSDFDPSKLNNSLNYITRSY